VILLRDFAELTIAEMAEKLRMQVPGVKSRLHRARELVREYLVGSPTALSRGAGWLCVVAKSIDVL
jgi:DNA-directed RNA polymerase specialized sigma24 family protein